MRPAATSEITDPPMSHGASRDRRRGPPRRCDRTVDVRPYDGMRGASEGVNGAGKPATVYWLVKGYARWPEAPIRSSCHEELGRFVAEELVMRNVPSVSSGPPEHEQVADA